MLRSCVNLQLMLFVVLYILLLMALLEQHLFFTAALVSLQPYVLFWWIVLLNNTCNNCCFKLIRWHDSMRFFLYLNCKKCRADLVQLYKARWKFEEKYCISRNFLLQREQFMLTAYLLVIFNAVDQERSNYLCCCSSVLLLHRMLRIDHVIDTLA